MTSNCEISGVCTPDCPNRLDGCDGNVELMTTNERIRRIIEDLGDLDIRCEDTYTEAELFAGTIKDILKELDREIEKWERE